MKYKKMQCTTGLRISLEGNNDCFIMDYSKYPYIVNKAEGAFWVFSHKGGDIWRDISEKLVSIHKTLAQAKRALGKVIEQGNDVKFIKYQLE
jgi:hypothetical protein